MASKFFGRIVTLGIEGLLRGMSGASHVHPASFPWKRGIRVTKNIAYGPGPDHFLDVYRPDASGPLPALLYLHGGGFSILSKDTHWMFGYGFAQQKFVVFNASYRLAPTHPYPAALEDACQVYQWVQDHAAEYGADPSRIVVAGESAGANLSMSVMMASIMRRPEPFAREVFARGVVPEAVLPACGLLEVGRAERYLAREDLPSVIRARISAICRAYLPNPGPNPDDYGLADPLRLIEEKRPVDRPMPPIFAACGDKDPVREDTQRLATAFAGSDRHQVRFYPKAGHAFHALFFTATSRTCWADHRAFLDAYVKR